MNKKQLIVMWVGIVIFILIGVFTRTHFSARRVRRTSGASWTNYRPLIKGLGSTALIAAGLIYTLKDKKKKDSNDSETDS